MPILSWFILDHICDAGLNSVRIKKEYGHPTKIITRLPHLICDIQFWQLNKKSPRAFDHVDKVLIYCSKTALRQSLVYAESV